MGIILYSAQKMDENCKQVGEQITEQSLEAIVPAVAELSTTFALWKGRESPPYTNPCSTEDGGSFHSKSVEEEM